MLIDKVRKLSPLDRLMYWIEEREMIRLHKEAGSLKPWTTDEILQSYRFCNVRRLDDKVSRWLLHNWYEPYRDHPNTLVAVAFARFINLPSTLERVTHLMFQPGKSPPPPDWNMIKSILRSVKKQGATIFNGAYIVRGNDGVDKVASVVDHFVSPLQGRDDILDTSSMQATHAALNECYGFGSFMAGQVVADLRWAMKGTWVDKMTWAPIGPGSKRGMNRLLGRAIDTPMKQWEFEERLSDLMDACHERLSPKITDRLEAMDFQNCLCEYDKYVRVLTGEGRPKQKYTGAV